ncbi:hypothetical protein HDU99_005759 [Rhizoclosmatium hyalinum]|nr:hypothetical protein HDU99_005759 [Rhizoclosmatium hyalinum]
MSVLEVHGDMEAAESLYARFFSPTNKSNYNLGFPLAATFKSLMRLNLAAGNLDRVKQLFGEYKETQLVDAQGMEILLDVWLTEGNVEEADKVYEEMQVLGYKIRSETVKKMERARDSLIGKLQVGVPLTHAPFPAEVLDGRIDQLLFESRFQGLKKKFDKYKKMIAFAIIALNLTAIILLIYSLAAIGGGQLPVGFYFVFSLAVVFQSISNDFVYFIPLFPQTERAVAKWSAEDRQKGLLYKVFKPTEFLDRFGQELELEVAIFEATP